MPKLYVISGCNGAGKTTASYAVLPEMLECREFVNADEIAKGLSPFNPSRVSIEAGRLMRQRMDVLLSDNADFAFETTLATRYYARFIRMAQERGYFVSLLYFWRLRPSRPSSALHGVWPRADTTSRPKWCGAATIAVCVTSRRSICRSVTTGSSTTTVRQTA